LYLLSEESSKGIFTLWVTGIKREKYLESSIWEFKLKCLGCFRMDIFIYNFLKIKLCLYYANPGNWMSLFKYNDLFL